MSHGLRFMEGYSVLPVYSPADILADDPVATSYVDLNNANWVTLAFHFGAITCDTPIITLEASTAAASNATELNVGFQYRLSVAKDTQDSAQGTITTATTVGYTMAATDDGKVVFVEVDPAAIVALGADYRYVRGVVDQGDATTVLMGCVAYIEPKYPGNMTISST